MLEASNLKNKAVGIGKCVPVRPLNAEPFFTSGNGLAALAANDVGLFFGQFSILCGDFEIGRLPPTRFAAGLPQNPKAALGRHGRLRSRYSA